MIFLKKKMCILVYKYTVIICVIGFFLFNAECIRKYMNYTLNMILYKLNTINNYQKKNIDYFLL